MDVLQWSRHYRCFPGQGAFDLADFVARVLAAGYAGPLSLEVFNDVFRQADPRPHGGRRDALAARARGRAAGRSPALRRLRVRRARRRRPSRRPRPRSCCAALGLRPRRPAPQQAGPAVAARRHPHRAQPRRGRRRPRGRRRRGRERRPAGVRDARRGAARPGARAPPRPRRGRPRGGRRARRHVGVLLPAPTRRWLDDFVAARAERRATACRSTASTTSRSPSRSTPSTRPGCSTARCSTSSRPRAPSSPRPTGWSAAARCAADGRVRIVLNVPGSGRHPERAGRAPARRLRLRRRARRRARDARARRAAPARSPATTTTTSPPATSSTRPARRAARARRALRPQRRAASSCTSTPRTSRAACSSRCSSGAAATTATAPRTHPSGWRQRSAEPPRGGDMQRTQVVEAEPVKGRFTRAASEERELPEAPPLRRLIGPSVILIGVGVASGEYILFPFIASQAGLVFLWAAVVGVARAVLHQHGDRALHARHRRDRDRRLPALWKPWGGDPRRRRDPRHDVAGLGHVGRHHHDVRVRRRRPERDRDRRPARDRRHADRVAGRLPDRREARSSSRSAPWSCCSWSRALRRDQRGRLSRTRARSSPASARSRARSRSRSSSARSRPPAPAAPTTSSRATGSATRASAWASYVPRIVSPITGQEEAAPDSERLSFPQDEANLGRWRTWWKRANTRAVRVLRAASAGSRSSSSR